MSIVQEGTCKIKRHQPLNKTTLLLSKPMGCAKCDGPGEKIFSWHEKFLLVPPTPLYLLNTLLRLQNLVFDSIINHSRNIQRVITFTNQKVDITVSDAMDLAKKNDTQIFVALFHEAQFFLKRQNIICSKKEDLTILLFDGVGPSVPQFWGRQKRFMADLIF